MPSSSSPSTRASTVERGRRPAYPSDSAAPIDCRRRQRRIAGSDDIAEELGSTDTSAADDAVRVVVVDDDHDVAEVLAEILKSNGYEVSVAHDGLVALALVEDYKPHCVLLDVNLPGMDGGELSRRLRERYGDDLILVAVTGWSETDARVSNAFGRVDHYLQKPIDVQMLSKVLPPVR